MNPQRLDPELVKRLCEKSKLATGSKWKWRKISESITPDLTFIEKQLDILIEEQKQAVLKIKEKRDARKVNNKETKEISGKEV